MIRAYAAAFGRAYAVALAIELDAAAHPFASAYVTACDDCPPPDMNPLDRETARRLARERAHRDLSLIRRRHLPA
jgi:hypothetical protein